MGPAWIGIEAPSGPSHRVLYGPNGLDDAERANQAGTHDLMRKRPRGREWRPAK